MRTAADRRPEEGVAFMLKTVSVIAAVFLGSASAFTSVASAQPREEFRHGEFREHPGQHRYGPRCFHRVSAEGFAHIDFFGGGGGGQKAQVRAIRHWSEQVASRFGGHLASWDRAQGKEARCDPRGTELHCVVSGHPCS